MRELTQNIDIAQARALLKRYQFEMRGHSEQEVMEKWLGNYPPRWVRMAIIEALYQGRYKAISVEGILKLWSRKGEIMHRFPHDFERLICNNLPYSIKPLVNSSGKPLDPSSPTPSEVAPPPQAENLSPQYSPPLPLNSQTQNPDLRDLNDKSEENQRLEGEIEITSLPKETLSHLETLFPQIVTEIEEKKTLSSSDFALTEEQSKRSPLLLSGGSIHEFTPLLDRSELYTKLKAVVEGKSES